MIETMENTHADSGNEQHTQAEAGTQAQTQAQAGENGQTQEQAATAKTFTQEQLESAIKERLKRESSALERKLKADYEGQWRPQVESLQAEKAELELKLALTKSTHDPDYAAFKIAKSESPGKYWKDGQLNEEVLFADFPNLKAPEPKPGPAPTSAGGGTNFKSTDMNTMIRRKAGRA